MPPRLGRPRLDRLVEDGIDVHAAAAVRYARQNAEWFELGARLFDDFWFALLQLPGIEIPMQPDDLRNGILRAPFFSQGRDAVIHTPSVSIVLLRECLAEA